MVVCISGQESVSEVVYRCGQTEWNPRGLGPGLVRDSHEQLSCTLVTIHFLIVGGP